MARSKKIGSPYTEAAAKRAVARVAKMIADPFNFHATPPKLTRSGMHDYIYTSTVMPKKGPGSGIDVSVSRLSKDSGFKDAGKNVLEVAVTDPMNSNLIARGGLLYDGDPDNFRLTQKMIKAVQKTRPVWFVRCKPAPSPKLPKDPIKRALIVF